jgi:hypothetical protein
MRKPRQQGSSSIEPEAEARGPARGLSRKSTREAASNLVGGGKIRCAIYTRKSSEEGLEQEFNSLDAQREACKAFVRSQRALSRSPSISTFWSISVRLPDTQIMDFARVTDGRLARSTSKKRGRDNAVEAIARRSRLYPAS